MTRARARAGGAAEACTGRRAASRERDYPADMRLRGALRGAVGPTALTRPLGDPFGQLEPVCLAERRRDLRLGVVRVVDVVVEIATDRDSAQRDIGQVH